VLTLHLTQTHKLEAYIGVDKFVSYLIFVILEFL